MLQLFKPRANAFTVWILCAIPVMAVLAAVLYFAYIYSSYATGVGVTVTQPVPFSHKHHAGVLDIGCRYCHNSVATSQFAGLPPTETCMTCHSRLYTDEEMLAPVRESLRTGVPLQWTRVYDLPDYVYFNHAIHVNKGIGCRTCHGRVDKMPLMQQATSLRMQWCLGCHRNPAKYVRPRDKIYSMTYDPTQKPPGLGEKLVKRYNIHAGQLTHCSLCHR